MEEDLVVPPEFRRCARGSFVSAPKEASRSDGKSPAGVRRDDSGRDGTGKKESRTWKVVNSHAQERLLASAKLKDRERSLAAAGSDRFSGTAKTAAGAAVRGKTAAQKPQQGKAFGFGKQDGQSRFAGVKQNRGFERKAPERGSRGQTENIGVGRGGRRGLRRGGSR